MRGPISLASVILLIAISVGFAQAQTAKTRPAAKKIHFHRTASRSVSKLDQTSIPQVIPSASLTFHQSEPVLETTNQSLSSYRSPVNLKLLFPTSQPSAQVDGKDPAIQAHLPSSEFVQAPAPAQTASRIDDPEYLARHVPVVGGFMQHVVQESKAHPHVTKVFQYIHPEF